jgi:membrane protease YdiL (CAAX protease family)
LEIWLLNLLGQYQVGLFAKESDESETMKFNFKKLTLPAKNAKTKKPLDKREVSFSYFFQFLRTHAVWIYIISILLVLVVELSLSAQAVFARNALFTWLGAALIGILFTLLAWWAWPKAPEIRAELTAPGWQRDLLMGLGGGVLAFALLIGLDAVFRQTLGGLYKGIQSASWAYHNWYYLLFALVGGGIMRPFGEEFLFRGYFLDTFGIKMKHLPANLLTTLLFAIRSADPFLFFFYFLAGLVYGWLAQHFRLRTAILASIVCNLLIILFETFLA